MSHKVTPYAVQDNPARDRNDPVAAVTAIEIHFPDTFSYKAWRVIRYFRGTMFLYAYNKQFVVTDESLDLTPFGDGSTEAPIGCPRWTGSSLDELERWLERIADENDASGTAIPGWETPRPFHQVLSVGGPNGPADNVMVKLTHDPPFIAVVTYDRQHGRHGRFLVWRETLEQMLEPSANPRREEDGGNYLTISREEDWLKFRFTWLNSYPNANVKGFQQSVVIPIPLVRSMLEQGCSIRYLYSPLRRSAEINTRPAAKTIHKIMEDKRLRRAFSKAMRDCFSWQGEHITLYPDWQDSFYFTTKSGFPKNGGLVLHEGDRDGHPYFYYSVHT